MEEISGFKCSDCNRIYASLSFFVQHVCDGGTDGGTTTGTTASVSSPTATMNNSMTNDVVTMAGNDEEQSQQGGAEQLQTPTSWKRPETLLLFEMYKKHQSKVVSGSMRKKKMWGLISQELAAYGYKLSASQVEGRWQTLTTRYKQVRDAPSGAARKTFEFESEMDEIFEGRPNITPVATINNNNTNTVTPKNKSWVPRSGEKKTSSANGKSKRKVKKELTVKKKLKITGVTELKSIENQVSDADDDKPPEEIESTSSGSSDEEQELEPVAKKRNTQASAIIDYLQKTNKENEKAQQKRHDDKMSVFKEFVGILKNMNDNRDEKD